MFCASVHCVTKLYISAEDPYTTTLSNLSDVQPGLKHTRIVVKWQSTRYENVTFSHNIFLLNGREHAEPVLKVSLLSQGEAFKFYSGSFGNMNKLWKLNFNLWLVFTHNT